MNSKLEKTYDCLCAGIIVADHICDPVDHLPVEGELVLSSRMSLATGGCAANVAVNLGKLGRKATIVGRVGRDVFGQFICEALGNLGVDCAHVVESRTADTSGSFIVNVRGQDRRFIHCTGANAEFTGDEITFELLAQCRAVYLGGYGLSDLPAAETIAARYKVARDGGALTILDVAIPGPADYWPRLRPILPHTDVFLPNNDEARIITGLDDPSEQAREFHRAGAKTVVITCGHGGAVLVDDSGTYRAERFPVEFVDGTGSGDAFAAGFIHARLAGHENLAALRYGSAQGASCVRAIGATAGAFDVKELEEYIASHDLAICRV
ncbi:MAG: carbohydrate kinase family protein [Planctomycetaceae bacterium]